MKRKSKRKTKRKSKLPRYVICDAPKMGIVYDPDGITWDYDIWIVKRKKRKQTKKSKEFWDKYKLGEENGR